MPKVRSSTQDLEEIQFLESAMYLPSENHAIKLPQDGHYLKKKI